MPVTIDEQVIKNNQQLLEQLPLLLNELADDETKIEEMHRVRYARSETIWSHIILNMGNTPGRYEELRALFLIVLKSLKTDEARLKLLGSFFYAQGPRKVWPSLYDYSSIHYLFYKIADATLIKDITDCLTDKTKIKDLLYVRDPGVLVGGNTILHMAALGHYLGFRRTLESLKSILTEAEFLSYIKIRNNRGNTVLQEVSRSEFSMSQMVNAGLIIDAYPNETERHLAIEEKNDRGQHVLHLFSYEQSITEYVLSLYTTDEDKQRFIEQTDNEGNTALHTAGNRFVLLALLDAYPDVQSKLAALKIKNNAGDTVLCALGKERGLSFSVALSLFPKNEILDYVFKRNPQSHLLECNINPCFSQAIMDRLNPEDKEKFVALLDEAEQNTQSELRTIDCGYTVLRDKIKALHDYGVTLQESSNEARKKAGGDAVQLSKKLKNSLIQYYMRGDINGRIISRQDFLRTLERGYASMSENRDLSVLHRILHAIATLLRSCFFDSQKATTPGIGENMHTYFAKTTRQDLVEDIHNTIGCMPK